MQMSRKQRYLDTLTRLRGEIRTELKALKGTADRATNLTLLANVEAAYGEVEISLQRLEFLRKQMEEYSASLLDLIELEKQHAELEK